MKSLFLILKNLFEKFLNKNEIKYLPISETYLKEQNKEDYRNSLKVNIKKRIGYYNGYGIQDERKISV